MAFESPWFPCPSRPPSSGAEDALPPTHPSKEPGAPSSLEKSSKIFIRKRKRNQPQKSYLRASFHYPSVCRKQDCRQLSIEFSLFNDTLFNVVPAKNYTYTISTKARVFEVNFVSLFSFLLVLWKYEKFYPKIHIFVHSWRIGFCSLFFREWKNDGLELEYENIGN
ncbi:MAG: hypothetical protein ACTSRV_10080 [Candidatus Freyarchaeota archaeon]